MNGKELSDWKLYVIDGKLLWAGDSGIADKQDEILAEFKGANWSSAGELLTEYMDSKNGSWRESGKAFVLRGFLKSDEFGSRGRQPLRFEQQVVEVAIAASAT